MQVLAITNQKGGVGKSSTASSIGSAYTAQGQRVLFVDLDAQGNLSYSIKASTTGKSAFDVLMGEATAPEALQHTAAGDIISASPALASADITLTATGKEYRLREALEALRGKYDLVIIDTPPALGILTVNALAAADGVIIPAQADFFSLQGIGQLNSTIEAVKKYCNPGLKVYGIVLTRYSARAIISREVSAMMEQTAAQLHTKLYKTKIRECTAVKEAQAMRESIFDFAPRSNAAADYKALAEEIEKEWKK